MLWLETDVQLHSPSSPDSAQLIGASKQKEQKKQNCLPDIYL